MKYGVICPCSNNDAHRDYGWSGTVELILHTVPICLKLFLIDDECITIITTNSGVVVVICVYTIQWFYHVFGQSVYSYNASVFV